MSGVTEALTQEPLLVNNDGVVLRRLRQTEELAPGRGTDRQRTSLLVPLRTGQDPGTLWERTRFTQSSDPRLPCDLP